MATIEQLYNHLKTLNKQWFYEKSEIDNELSDVIRESATSGLIKNDGSIDTTDYADSTTLANVATSGSYLDLEDIPEEFAPSSHEHSSAEVKDANAHANLGTSANATQSAINTAIDTKIGALLSTDLVVLDATLPTASASTMNKIHLVPEEDTETNDTYEVYITVEDGGNYSWEKLDTARIDLTGYATIDHVHGNISNDGKIGTTANQFVYTATGGLVSTKSTVGNITTDGAIGSDSGKVVVTTTSGVLTTSDWVTEVDSVIQQLTTHGNTLNNSQQE